LETLVQTALEGNIASIARLITLVETTGEKAQDVQKEIFPHTGYAHLVGITGPAGAGKSTLISKLAAKLASCGQKVAIVACDPSSPNTGGALLGDRIRMHELTHDDNIFVRSIATGSSIGGLPLAAFRATDILDACGFNTVIIETVGTGQNQTDIMQAAHTIIAVSAPGLGDDIQAMKSGLMEIADIHAITKSDLTGAGKTLMEIKNAVRMRQKNNKQHDSKDQWQAMVHTVNGLSGEGINDLHGAIQAHFSYLQTDDNMRMCQRHMYQQRIYREAIDILSQSFRTIPDKQLSENLERLINHEISPTQAAWEAIGKLR